MRRATHAMWLLYASLAIGLIGCALISHQARHWPGVLFFGGAAIGSALAIVHTSWLLDEYRHVLAQHDADTRARTQRAAEDDAVQLAVAAASCCETSWATAGAEHHPDHCTRKDQTT
jgi:hypothetical protein